MTTTALVILILVLLALNVWIQRLRARGVLTDEHPLGLVIRERITGRPAQLTKRNYREAKLRYYRMAILTTPIVTSVLVAAIAAITHPSTTLKPVMGAAFLSGVFVLVSADGRFTDIPTAQRIISASISGLLAAMLAVFLIAAVDPHAVLTSTPS